MGNETTPLRPVLLRTLERLAILLAEIEHPDTKQLYEAIGTGSRTAVYIKELRERGLVGRTPSPGHIWITDAGRAVLEDCSAARARAKQLAETVRANRQNGAASF